MPWRVYLAPGGRVPADVWRTAGYRVDGDTVWADDADDADRIAMRACGSDAVRVAAEDGVYYYRSLDHAAADDTGAMASAVVDRGGEDSY
jgi:hypothetical protein